MCSWDEKAPVKIQKALEEVILEFTREIQAVRERREERKREREFHIFDYNNFCFPFSPPPPSLLVNIRKTVLY